MCVLLQSADEETSHNSLSLPLLPKLPLSSRDALSAYEDAAGARCLRCLLTFVKWHQSRS